MLETTHMELKKDREFGEAITDLIALFKENFKPLLSIYLRYGLSILLVGFLLGMITNSMIDTNFDSQLSDQNGPLGMGNPLALMGGLGNIVFMFFYMLSILTMTAAIFAYMNGYDEGGVEAAIRMVRDKFGTNLGKVFGVYLVIILVVLLAGLVGFLLVTAVGPFAMLLMFPGLIALFYFGVRYSLATYIATMSGFSIIDAFKESAKLVDGRFWWTLGLIFVVGLIGSILRGILSIPMSIMSMLPLLQGGDPSAISSMGTTMLVSNFLVYAGFMIYFMIQTLLIPLIYYSLHDQKYGVQLEEQIERVERKRDSLFENEGEV